MREGQPRRRSEDMDRRIHVQVGEGRREWILNESVETRGVTINSTKRRMNGGGRARCCHSYHTNA